MKPFRTLLFWTHLSCGALAGVVILIMSVTGVALTYEKQAVEWADRRAWTPPANPGVQLPPESLLARVAAERPGVAPIAVTMRADAEAPATVTLDGNALLLVDPYTGSIIGEPPAALRSFFRTMTTWHRYLAMQGESRATGRMFTGSANVIFLFIVLSGLYLWIPRVWKWIQFKQVLWFRRGLAAKAREFNWHNVIGIWSAIPLAIIVASALPMSYQWAGNLLYRVNGEAPPSPSVPRAPEGKPASFTAAGVDAAWLGAQQRVPGWRTMTTRLSASERAPVVIAIDEGYGGQPQARTTFTFDRARATVTKTETFGDLTRGRQWRTWSRFAHTGEYYGMAGQTIAGLASAGGAFLVYTGISLSVRRLAGWLRRAFPSAAPFARADGFLPDRTPLRSTTRSLRR